MFSKLFKRGFVLRKSRNETPAQVSEQRIAPPYASYAAKVAVERQSDIPGYVIAFNNAARFVYDKVELTNMCALAEGFRDRLAADGTSVRFSAGREEEKALCAGGLLRMAEVCPAAGQFFCDAAEELCSHPEGAGFAAVLDKILEHWPALCACRDTYVVLSVAASLCDGQIRTRPKDLETFLNALEIASQNWPE